MPHHRSVIPDQILVAPGIPRTRTGKKLEVPLKRLAQGADPELVVTPSAVDDVGLLRWFVSFFAERCGG